MTATDDIPNQEWRLSHRLVGHTSDVKAVETATIADREVVFSVSRDTTARCWSRTFDATSGSPASGWTVGPTFDGGRRYVNAVTFVPRRKDDDQDCILLGSLDSLIRVYALPSDITDPGHISEPQQIIQEHYDNVCGLRFRRCIAAQQDDDDLVISASWDGTARSFRRDIKGKWHLKHLLKGHESAVWGVEIINAGSGREEYLTSSADLFVRLFEGEQCKVVWAGRQDVARDVRLLPGVREQLSDKFASSSNDPSILVFSLSPEHRPPNVPTNGGDPLQSLTGHTSIVYSLAILQTSDASLLVSSSEDGTVRLWDWAEERNPLRTTIPQPVSSVWGCGVLPATGDIVTANDDGVVRVFTARHQADSGLGEVTMEELEDHALKCEEVAQVAGRKGVTSEIVSASMPPTLHSSAAQATRLQHPDDGQYYDALVPIDVSDDAAPLLLGISRGDDAHQVTREFLQRHSLPSTYEDRIVDFIHMVGPK